MGAPVTVWAGETATAGGEMDEIYRLVESRDYDQALRRLDVMLRKDPKNVPGRFLMGVVLTEQKRRDEAIKVYRSLTEDYPELPEPYNNLAVLYAEQGGFDQAKEALQKAIQTHPTYATAHENLGDIYAQMASQAYGKALQLNRGNAAAQSKLAVVKKLIAQPRSPVPAGGGAAGDAILQAKAEAERQKREVAEVKAREEEQRRLRNEADRKAREENARLESERRKEEARLAAEQRKEEATRIEAERRKEELTRQEAERRQAEETRLAAERKKEETARQEGARRQEEAARREEAAQREAQRQESLRLEAQRKKEESQRLEAERKEAQRLDSERKKEEAARLAERKKEEATRKEAARLEAQRRKEESARLDLERKKEEAARQARIMAQRSMDQTLTAVDEASRTGHPLPVSAGSGGSLNDGTREELERTVQSWARSWAGKDVEGYLQHYSNQFKPDTQGNLAAWKKLRSERLLKPRFIQLQVWKLRMKEAGEGQMKVTFSQTYRSDNVKDTVEKSLLMKQENGAWKIVREMVEGN
ncbi:MAG: tetratricopeptide repeat protein [Magnetococcales bacterium]|nr:tetratricopeptide repeat protein [Magnetococcales bacterium]